MSHLLTHSSKAHPFFERVPASGILTVYYHIKTKVKKIEYSGGSTHTAITMLKV